MEPGPSSLSSSVSGRSSIRIGLISSELARALKERLQVTSGDDTFTVLLAGSMENTVLSWRTGRAFLASSITWARLSLSIIVAGAVEAESGCDLDCCCDLFLRRLRARSPGEGASSCAEAALGTENTMSAINQRVGNIDRMISVADERLRAQRSIQKV